MPSRDVDVARFALPPSVPARLRDWREMKPLIAAIYARHSAGCCWHLVLDDGNVDDSAVEFCVNYAKTNRDCETPVACCQLGGLMVRASMTQRKRAARAH